MVEIPRLDTIEETETANVNVAIMDLFAQTDLLSHLSIKYLNEIIKAIEAIPVSAGQVIIEDNEINNCYYIIQSGICELIEKRAGEEEVFATLERGDAYGEEALILSTPSRFLVRMRTDGVLLLLGKHKFETLIKQPLLNKITLDEIPLALEIGSKLVDIRLDKECDGKRIKGGINIEKTRFSEQIYQLDRNINYIICSNNVIESSCYAFKLMQKGINAVYLSENVSRCFYDIENLTAQTTKNRLNNLEHELIKTKRVLQDAVNKNKALIKEKNLLRSKCINFQKLLKKTFSTQKFLVNERKRMKLHLAGVRQAIRNDLRSMIDTLNAYVRTKNSSLTLSHVSKKQHIQELLSLGGLVVTSAKRINFRTQQITSSTKILKQLEQAKAKKQSVAAPKQEQHQTTKDSTGQTPQAAQEPAKKGNVVDFETTNKDNSTAKENAPLDDFMERYEQTMWKTQDVQRLKDELEDTHTSILITDIEKYLSERDN